MVVILYVSAKSLQECLTLGTLWIVDHEAPLSLGFSMQEYWSGLPCPPGDLPDPRLEPVSLMSPALEGEFFITSATRGSLVVIVNSTKSMSSDGYMSLPILKKSGCSKSLLANKL